MPETLTIPPDSYIEEAARRVKEMQVRRLLAIYHRDKNVRFVAQADTAREYSDRRLGRTVDRISQRSKRASGSR